MILNFLFAKLNTIMFTLQIIIFLCVFVKLFFPQILKNISYKYFVLVIILLHIFYASFAVFGQYTVWNKNEFTKILLTTPLTKEVVFPVYIGWLRPIFDSSHGSFMLYSFTHFLLNTIILFLFTLFFVIFLKIYKRYRPDNFRVGDIAIIAIAFLIAGFPGVLVLIPFSFAVIVIITALNLNSKTVNQIYFPATFLCLSLLALFFAKSLLAYLSLWYN